MRKRSIGVSLATLTVALVAMLVPGVSGGAPSTGDTNGPGCRDINGPGGVGGQFNYTQTSFNTTGPNTFNLNAQLLLGADGTDAPCKQVTYTLYVIVDGNDQATATAYPQDGNVQWTGITVTDDDPNICVYATTSHNGKVFDTAPDANCLVVTAGTTGGGGGFV